MNKRRDWTWSITKEDRDKFLQENQRPTHKTAPRQVAKFGLICFTLCRLILGELIPTNSSTFQKCNTNTDGWCRLEPAHFLGGCWIVQSICLFFVGKLINWVDSWPANASEIIEIFDEYKVEQMNRNQRCKCNWIDSKFKGNINRKPFDLPCFLLLILQVCVFPVKFPL